MCYNTLMRNVIYSSIGCSIVLAAVCFAVACTEAPPPVDPSYKAEVEEWRHDRLERLTADDGWLTLSGLFWLEPGENSFGSAEDNAVVLPDATVPAVAGRLVLDAEGTVTAVAETGAGVTINGQAFEEARLKTDAEGEPDVVTAGRIRFYIIDREGRLAVRVKDPQAATRTSFTGIDYYPIDPTFRVEARLEAYDAPKEVAVATETGVDTTFTAPGVLQFTVNGDELTLEPFLSGEKNENYFLIFRDTTSGETTYGAGRFLYASAADQSGMTVLDFNLAYNPPCAFTAFATCPLAPPQNWLPVPIEAGEKYPGDKH
jgi:uncharacterized protein (DUF1684 family)